MNIDDIRELNKKKIAELNDSSNNEDTEKQKMIQEKIRKIIEKDDAIFFKLQMNEALNLLNCLVDANKDELLEIYKSLISPKSFNDLESKFKI